MFSVKCTCIQVLNFRYKDGEIISSNKTFVYPEDYIFSASVRRKGTLLILNIVAEDSGLYECKNEASDVFEELSQPRRIRAYRVSTQLEV